MPRLLITVVGFLIAASPVDAFATGERTWTDSQGNKVKARFLTITEGTVRLRQDRKPYAIPFYQLSREDRDYIRNVLNERGEGNLVPSIGEPRQWTYRNEEFEAEFVGPQKNDIILLRNDRPVTLSFADFSRDDQEYVRRALVSKGQGHLVPRVEAQANAAAAAPPAGRTPFGPRAWPPPGRAGMGGGPMAGAPMPAGQGALGGGNVPTYRPGAAAPTNPFVSGNASGYGAAGGGLDSHGPAHVGYDPAGSHALPTATSPRFDPQPVQIPSFDGLPGSGYGSPGMTRYCPKCNRQYSESAIYCTDCSSSFRWRRYSVFGAIIGAVIGVLGAVYKAINS